MNDIQIYAKNGSYYETNAYSQPDPFKFLPSPNKGLTFPPSTMIKMQARKVSYQISTLGQTTQVYTSPSYDDMVALADYFSDWSCNYEIQEGPIHTFTATAPWDTMTSADFFVSLYASEQWELQPQMDSKPLYANGLLADSFVPPTDPGNYVIFPTALQVAIDNAVKNNTYLNLPPSSSYYPYNKQALQAQQYMKQGITHVPTYTQTLKRTAVIDKNNRNNAFNNAADNIRYNLNQQGTVNYLMHTDDLINNYFIPRDTVGKFMNRSYAKKANTPNFDVYNWTTYAAWLVKPPSFNFISRNKVQITQEFVWNEWMEGLYYILSPKAKFGDPIIIPTNSPTIVPQT